MLLSWERALLRCRFQTESVASDCSIYYIPSYKKISQIELDISAVQFELTLIIEQYKSI